MDKVWTIVIDTFVGLIIMIVSVAIYFSLRTETVIKTQTTTVTENMLLDTKKNGCITADDYERFIEELSRTGSVFDISLVHSYEVAEPEYRLRTLEEVIAAQNAAYAGTNIYHYHDVVTEKPVVSDYSNTGTLNTETNESILAKAVNTSASPSHVHTQECYTGHTHVGDFSFIHTHKHTSACIEYEMSRYADVKCRACGITSHKILVTRYWDPDSGEVKVGYAPGGDSSCWACGSSNTTTTYVSSYGYSCGYNNDINNDGYSDAVGTSQAYQYKRIYPQDQSIKATYTSGCYKYNNSVSVPVSVYDYYGNAQYFSGQWEQIYLSGLSPYCYVPQDYELKYQWGSGSQAYVSPTFRLKYDNGVATFKYIGGSNMNIYDNFPSVDFQTLRSLASDGTKLYNYLHANAVQTYIQSGGSASMNKMYGRIQICNDTIHGQWYAACGLEENGVLGCNQLIKEIVPTNPVQTVYTGDPLITTAVASYLDGSTKTVVCTSSFSTAGIVQNQTAMLTYTYMIGSISYSKSCSITVTVIPRNKTCVNGHTYNMRADGSDPGCPYCRAWVRNLRVTNPATSTLTITIGTTLQENGITLLATYYDGHTETITNGYEDNLDKSYLGTKPVTIGYKGAAVQLMVTTVCAKMTCDICGYVYDLYPDGTNPGCPRCQQKIPVFTGNVIYYEEAVYTDEILEELYTKGIYRFNTNDVFTIKIKSKSKTLARSIMQKIYPGLSDQWYSVTMNETVGSK